MRNLMLGVTAFTMLAASPLIAQDWSGQWQGTLEIFKVEQMLIEIAKGDDGAWKFVLRNVTYGGRANVASPVSIQGTRIRCYILCMGGEFEGRISADSSAITASWTQFGRTQPFNLVRRTTENAYPIPELPKRPPVLQDPNPALKWPPSS
jgi:hypothetical protein